MWYPQNGSIAIGSRRSVPTLPVAAAVVSDDIVAPRNTPCCQLNASWTSGTTPARRPPNRIAEIGTPLGSSHSGAITGHCLAGTVKRALAWAALRRVLGVHGRRTQSVRCSGAGLDISSHQTSWSCVMAQLVNTVLRVIVFIALAFDAKLVPGATPKN